MSAAMIWILIGILLILSELLATSIIAVFLGISAILVGLLLNWNLIEGTAIQFTIFGISSLILLLFARGKLKSWFSGHTTDESDGKPNFKEDIGHRVKVVDDFEQGAGRVVLNGVKWDAYSTDDLKAGETAWVVSNEGIHLTVERNQPQAIRPDTSA